MSDLIDERTALTQTRAIVAQIPGKTFGKKQYKELVRTIYEQQLKKHTKLNRMQRHNRCKDLFKMANRGATGVKDSPALLSEIALRQVLNEKQDETKAEQGSTK